MSPFAQITGWGMAVPEKVLTNSDLEQIVDTTDEWILARTGIKERRIAQGNETTASLAVKAGLNALQKAGLKPVDLDLIIVATSSPEHIFPATACLVQDRIGAIKAGAFDLSGACTGFILALDMASQAIKTESIQNALVIGSETLSKIVDWEDRNTCILFGDGAGAFVLQAGEDPAGLLSSVKRSDGSGGDLLSVPGGGSKMPFSAEVLSERKHFIHMDGKEVYRFASRVMAQATMEAVEKANLTLDDIELIIPHQANRRIIESAIRKIKYPMEKVVVNLDRYGNTSTASIPIAVCEAVEEGRLKPNDHAVLVGFGAGLTWGAVVIEWSGPVPGRARIRPVRYKVYAWIRSFFLKLLRRIDALIWNRKSR